MVLDCRRKTGEPRWNPAQREHSAFSHPLVQRLFSWDLTTWGPWRDIWTVTPLCHLSCGLRLKTNINGPMVSGPKPVQCLDRLSYTCNLHVLKQNSGRRNCVPDDSLASISASSTQMKPGWSPSFQERGELAPQNPCLFGIHGCPNRWPPLSEESCGANLQQYLLVLVETLWLATEAWGTTQLCPPKFGLGTSCCSSMGSFAFKIGRAGSWDQSFLNTPVLQMADFTLRRPLEIPVNNCA